MKNVLIVAVIGSLTCLLRQEAVAQTANSSPFLDSIAEQDDLSVEQIKSHTLIDSVYYTGMFSRAGFTWRHGLSLFQWIYRGDNRI